MPRTLRMFIEWCDTEHGGPYGDGFVAHIQKSVSLHPAVMGQVVKEGHLFEMASITLKYAIHQLAKKIRECEPTTIGVPYESTEQDQASIRPARPDEGV